MTKPLQQKRKKSKATSRPISHLKKCKNIKVFSTVKLETLPNEVILHVFNYLKIVNLLKCGQVSKRFQAISNVEYLWPKKFNLFYKKVPVGFLQKLLDHGIKYLSLSEAIVEGTLSLQKASRLKYLNLTGFERTSNRENSEKMLEASYSLEKLSLNQMHLSSKLISNISLQNGTTLKVLDLSCCTFCINENNCTYRGWAYPKDSNCTSDIPIKQIVENCTELKELNLSIDLCEKSIEFLVSNLTSKIEKLSLFWMPLLRDEHIKTLVTRCNKMTELNLGGKSSITRHSLNFVIEHLQSTLVKLSLHFSRIVLDSNDCLKLKSMEKLKLLCCNKQKDPVNMQMLKKMLPNLQIDFHNENIIIASPNWVMGGEMENHRRFWEINAEAEESNICKKRESKKFGGSHAMN